MDIKQYISSGILEDYVLFMTSDQERREVECMAKIYPEIKKELEVLQSAMQSYIELNKINPPDHVKARIFQTIKNQADSSSDTAKSEILDNITGGKVKSFSNSKWAVAATGLLLIGTMTLYYFNSKKIQALNNELVSLNVEKQQLLHRTTDFARRLDILSNPDVRRIRMSGLPQRDSSLYAMIFWDPKSNELFLDQNNLSALSQDKQYQLWAIRDGVPVDMGVFDGLPIHETQIQKMKSVDKAEAFAVTIEKRGGVQSPTLSEMVVIGKI